MIEITDDVLKKSGIYKITNIANNKMYIGSAFCIRDRWYLHKSELRRNKHRNNHLQNAWNKYNEESFSFEIIELVDDLDIIIEREQYWMDFHKSYDLNIGYNVMAIAGNQKGRTLSEETKEKLRILNTGEKNPQYGKSPSEETREKQRQALSGEKSPLFGKKKPKELVDRIKEKQLARHYKHGEEQLKKMSIAATGRIKSESTRLKISESKKGLKHHNCKLTEKDVLEIREKYSTNEYSLIDLATEYNTGKTNISKIVKRLRWKHI